MTRREPAADTDYSWMGKLNGRLFREMASSTVEKESFGEESFAGERLSPLDNMFLLSEGPTAPMHIAITSLFAKSAFTASDDGVDVERIRACIAARLHLVPRYRQRLVFPLAGLPRWVDDDAFDISYHVRHISLPRPGTEQQLQWIAAAIKAQPLDRNKPLWEMWIVEGLGGDRFAMITKVHHCMIDGVSGAALLEVLFQPEPQPPADPLPFRPRATPPPLAILRNEIGRRVRAPIAMMSRLVHHPSHVFHDVGDGLSAIATLLPAGLRPATYTPINKPLGPHRRFDWIAFDLPVVKEIKNRLGGSINDVVLATVAGAVRSFLRHRGTNVDALDFRALVPVNVRNSDERGTLGNRVAAWIVHLPVHDPDPLRRLAVLCSSTASLKQSHQAAKTDALTSLTAWTGQSLLSAAIRLAFLARPFNIVITNVPGPQFPLYLLDAPLLAVYPQVPLFTNQNLGIALFSYNGKLHWGFNADRDQVPDLPVFVDAIDSSFVELCRAAKLSIPRSRRRPPLRITECPAPKRGALPRSTLVRTRFGVGTNARSTVRPLHP